jgi:hypothetical protein
MAWNGPKTPKLTHSVLSASEPRPAIPAYRGPETGTFNFFALRSRKSNKVRREFWSVTQLHLT